MSQVAGLGRGGTAVGSQPRLSRGWIRSRRLLISLGSVAGGLVIWQLAALLYSSVLFPTATSTASALYRELASGPMAHDLFITVLRVLAGFLIGSVAGMLFGLLLGSSALLRASFEPHLNFFRFVTPIAWIAPATIWFGIGETARMFLIVYATVFIVAVNTMAGVAGIHRDRVRMARTFGADRQQMFFAVTLPASIPFILTGMRIGMGNSFMTVVGAEMLAGGNGLGFEVYNARLFFASDVMFAAIVLLGILGFLFDRAFVIAERRFFRRFNEGR